MEKAIPDSQATEYDVCLSFSGADRAYVEDVAKALRRLGVSCFYDEFEWENIWGKNLIDELDRIYPAPPAHSPPYSSSRRQRLIRVTPPCKTSLSLSLPRSPR